SDDATGYYGTLTAAAVTHFQTKYGIDAIGSVGPLTRAKITSVSQSCTTTTTTPVTTGTNTPTTATSTATTTPALPGYQPGQIIYGGGGGGGGGGGTPAASCSISATPATV